MDWQHQYRLHVSPGDTTTVSPGIREVHRIANESSQPVITLHVYGRDLREAPERINLPIPGLI